MNRSILIGAVAGAGIALAGGGIAGYKMVSEPKFAQVVAVTPVTERIETPREECHDQQVTRQKAVKDRHQVAGTVIGAVAGGLLGNALGGGGSNTGAKVAGAVAGGYAGNKAQEHIQDNNTETVTEQVCNTVTDVTERTIGFDVEYSIGEKTGQVRMDHDPGDTIPLRDGQLVLAEQTVPVPE
jgi:uncharacterized protein YcfJ